LARRRIHYPPVLNAIDYFLNPITVVYRLFFEGQVDRSGSIKIYESVFVSLFCEGDFLCGKETGQGGEQGLGSA
jgi:hypothetical protein